MTRHSRTLSEAELDHLLAYQVAPVDPQAVGGWAASNTSIQSVARIPANLSTCADVTASLGDSSRDSPSR